MKAGVIGLGFMGGVHLNAWQQIDAAQVVAVCDANPVAGKAKQGNIDAGSDELNLDGVRIYTDVADMLENESLDAVSITLPTHLHKSISIQCLEAGVHVLCEKPMALNTDDCQEMISAAYNAGKELMVAHCIRFWPEYVWLEQMDREAVFGKIRSAEFERLTYAPAWSGDSWFSDPEKSGGIALDLHIHDLDFIQYLLGVPKSMKAQTKALENGAPGQIQTWLDYGGPMTVTATASWLYPESFGFKMAYKVVFEKGTAIFDGKELLVYTEDGSTFKPQLETGDGYQGEIRYFADLLSGKIDKRKITAEEAAESVRMALESVSQELD